MSFLALRGTRQRSQRPSQFEPREGNIPKLVVQLESAERKIILHVVGSLTIEHIEVLNRGLQRALRAGFSRIIVDLSDCTYIDSAGAAVLVLALTQTRKLGVNLVVSGVGPQVRSILELLGLDRVLTSSTTFCPDDRPSALSANCQSDREWEV